MSDKCPWCRAEPSEFTIHAPTRGDWVCGSSKRNQTQTCRILELQSKLSLISSRYNELCRRCDNHFDELVRLQSIIDKHLHIRRCWDCTEVFYSPSDTLPGCRCPACGSADTRRRQ